MLSTKYVSLLLRLRCFAILLLIGLLPVRPALARSLPETFGKSLPADGAQDQPTSLQLRWDSESGTAIYEYCIDTIDNDACDATWEGAGNATLANVKLAANTAYYWQVRASDGLKTYSDDNTWWSFTTGSQLQTSRRTSAMPLKPFQADEKSIGEADILPLANLLQDSSFEAYTPNPYWSELDSAFGTPLCNEPDCEYWLEAHPRTGNVWAWFGGVIEPVHTASLSQSVIFPSCGNAKLQFYFWIGYAQPGSGTNDQFFARVDGVTVFSANATQVNSYPGYTLISVNVNQFANGASHTIQFSHVNTGHDVGFNLDDVALVGCPVISGNAGVADATLSYTGGSTAADGSGNYSFKVPFGWSGTVTPSKTSYLFSPTKRTYTTVNQDQTFQNYTATRLYSISGNVGIAGVTLSYTDGTPKAVTSQPNGSYSLTVPENWSGTVTPTHGCFTFSPISRNYSNVFSNQATQDYTPAFNAAAGCADIEILVGGANQGRFALLPQASTRASFTGVNNGPVKIVSTNSIPLIGAERLIYKAVGGVNTSFSEMMGLPNSQLDTTYWLPWYNNVDLDTQLRFANVSGSPATVTITIGGQPMGSPIQLAAGTSTRVSFAGVNNGPVKIVSDQNIVAAERLIYKVNGKNASFSEMMALPNKQLDKTYWLPWYNNVDLETQLRFANITDQPASVQVFIGGQPKGSPIQLAAGASTRISFAGVNNGPVKIVSDQNIVAAERVIYKVNGVNTSFSEMMALPSSQLNTTYWLPWYNNVDLDTQLRFANVHDTQTATVRVYLGGVEMPSSPFTLLPGESTRRSFAAINNGPVKILSDIPIVAAERLIYKVSGVNTSFSEMMALPASQLDTTYWLPWYNNVDLDTQLRFGMP